MAQIKSVIVDTEAGRITARLNAPGAPYNLAVSPDGKTLVATLKGAQAVSIIDLSTGTERARVPSSQPVTHGVIIAPDNQYAFVTSEGIGATPGAVDVINLTTDCPYSFTTGRTTDRGYRLLENNRLTAWHKLQHALLTPMSWLGSLR